MTTTARSPGTTAEHDRLAQATGRAEDDLFESNPWYEWGPYLSERAWGTVREDYSDMVMPGASFLMIMRAPGPTAGMKTAWPVCQTFTTIFVSRWRCGTVSTRS
jgi:hypothetical protein